MHAVGEGLKLIEKYHAVLRNIVDLSKLPAQPTLSSLRTFLSTDPTEDVNLRLACFVHMTLLDP